nr:hypothetical protein CKG001_00880 [Bdellovibrio sp. CKG001]BFD61409.1 hypothetical protein BdHM001_00900 [Bdellovibrio sp. HM001]
MKSVPRHVLLILFIGVASNLFTPESSSAMSKALNLFSMAGSKIGSFFSGRFGSGSSCTNCESSYDGPKPPLGTALPVWHYHDKGQTWSTYTLEAIDREGLANYNPKDATSYCPNWNNLTLSQRRAFWLQFASKLSEIESGFRSTATYMEHFGVSSNGLFSMSKGDSCGLLKTTADTFNDKKNIDCAIKTMRMYLDSSPYIGTGSNRGLGRYWQPLIDNPKRLVAQTRANKRAILNYTRSLPYCRAQ